MKFKYLLLPVLALALSACPNKQERVLPETAPEFSYHFVTHEGNLADEIAIDSYILGNDYLLKIVIDNRSWGYQDLFSFEYSDDVFKVSELFESRHDQQRHNFFFVITPKAVSENASLVVKYADETVTTITHAIVEYTTQFTYFHSYAPTNDAPKHMEQDETTIFVVTSMEQVENEGFHRNNGFVTYSDSFFEHNAVVFVTIFSGKSKMSSYKYMSYYIEGTNAYFRIRYPRVCDECDVTMDYVRSFVTFTIVVDQVDAATYTMNIRQNFTV